jgi:DNA-directed RNA polymerase subunit RPC12/RpoP
MTERYVCGKCKSAALYRDDDLVEGAKNIACRVCGNRYPGGIAPIILIKKEVVQNITENTPKVIPQQKAAIINISRKEEKTMAKTTNCRNCGRGKPIVQDGLCGGCVGSFYRNKYQKGTPEYDTALAEAKKRFTDPSYKRLPRGRAAKNQTDNPDYKKATEENREHYKHVADEIVNRNPVIELLIKQRNELQEKVFKINQAIELLS